MAFRVVASYLLVLSASASRPALPLGTLLAPAQLQHELALRVRHQAAMGLGHGAQFDPAMMANMASMAMSMGGSGGKSPLPGGLDMGMAMKMANAVSTGQMDPAMMGSLAKMAMTNPAALSLVGLGDAPKQIKDLQTQYFGTPPDKNTPPHKEKFMESTDALLQVGKEVHDLASPPYSWMWQLGTDAAGLVDPKAFKYFNVPNQVATYASYVAPPAQTEDATEVESNLPMAALNTLGTYISGGDPVNAMMNSLEDKDPAKKVVGMMTGREDMDPKALINFVQHQVPGGNDMMQMMGLAEPEPESERKAEETNQPDFVEEDQGIMDDLSTLESDERRDGIDVVEQAEAPVEKMEKTAAADEKIAVAEEAAPAPPPPVEQPEPVKEQKKVHVLGESTEDAPATAPTTTTKSTTTTTTPAEQPEATKASEEQPKAAVAEDEKPKPAAVAEDEKPKPAAVAEDEKPKDSAKDITASVKPPEKPIVSEKPKEKMALNLKQEAPHKASPAAPVSSPLGSMLTGLMKTKQEASNAKAQPSDPMMDMAKSMLMSQLTGGGGATDKKKSAAPVPADPLAGLMSSMLGAAAPAEEKPKPQMDSLTGMMQGLMAPSVSDKKAKGGSQAGAPDLMASIASAAMGAASGGGKGGTDPMEAMVSAALGGGSGNDMIAKMGTMALKQAMSSGGGGGGGGGGGPDMAMMAMKALMG